MLLNNDKTFFFSFLLNVINKYANCFNNNKNTTNLR